VLKRVTFIQLLRWALQGHHDPLDVSCLYWSVIVSGISFTDLTQLSNACDLPNWDTHF